VDQPAIDYQVGDVVRAKFWKSEEFLTPELFCLVVNISEKGVFLKVINGQSQIFLVSNDEMHLLCKDETGTILYGYKEE
jgi:hypothetical protein